MQYGEWTTLRYIPKGLLFETADGVFAMKSEYTYSNDNLQCLCILYGSGEYAHFKEGNNERCREVILPMDY